MHQRKPFSFHSFHHRCPDSTINGRVEFTYMLGSLSLLFFSSCFSFFPPLFLFVSRDRVWRMSCFWSNILFPKCSILLVDNRKICPFLKWISVLYVPAGPNSIDKVLTNGTPRGSTGQLRLWQDKSRWWDLNPNTSHPTIWADPCKCSS